jgi:hypothetical protein
MDNQLRAKRGCAAAYPVKGHELSVVDMTVQIPRKKNSTGSPAAASAVVTRVSAQAHSTVCPIDRGTVWTVVWGCFDGRNGRTGWSVHRWVQILRVGTGVGWGLQHCAGGQALRALSKHCLLGCHLVYKPMCRRTSGRGRACLEERCYVREGMSNTHGTRN